MYIKYKENMDTLKTCLRCEESKPITGYYKAGAYYQSLCKQCHNSRRNEYYKKRPKGFLKLPIETQNNIRADLKTNKKTTVAKKYNLSYSTLVRWVREGQCQ